MLGRAVMKRCDERHEVAGTTRAEADLTAPEAASLLFERHRPDWVVHCAAFTRVDAAEQECRAVMDANALATKYLATACQNHAVGITLVSTDYVFDGRSGAGYSESQPRDPVNTYGLSKARAEENIEQLTTPWQIVRTSWLFGDGPANFVKTMRRLLGEREFLRVVDDQLGCPTYVDDLAAVLMYLVEGGYPGVFHATNQGRATWCDLAREVARCLQVDPSRIVACSSDEYPTVAKRPANSVLLSQHLEEVGCPVRPAWQDAVARYVARLENGQVVFP